MLLIAESCTKLQTTKRGATRALGISNASYEIGDTHDGAETDVCGGCLRAFDLQRCAVLARRLPRIGYLALLIAVLLFGPAPLYWVCIFLPPALSILSIVNPAPQPAATES